jgi:serine/threonine protein kinase
LATTGEQHRQRYEKRRRELQRRAPGHFCHVCTSVAYEEDLSCFECETERPERGWQPLSESMDLWLGRVIEQRYLLTRRIGQGASASVYRAESLAIFRQFAVKVIHPPQIQGGLTLEQITGRLQREIEALGRLRNPHIVRFYDVIELNRQQVAVVMDFVEGETLEELVTQDGALEVERACTILRQLANGVYEAHLAGLTHRDLKPENVMVERLPAGDDFVHVLDFGIVHMEGEVSLTQGFIGTPLYASPEQALGEVVDHRSDIYSLGAIFFFMLSGRPPFVGNYVMQVLRQHVEHPPPKLRALRPEANIPVELEAMVLRMLAKHPSQRPQTLAEVIRELDALVIKLSNGVTEAEDAWGKASHRSNETSMGLPVEGRFPGRVLSNTQPDSAVDSSSSSPRSTGEAMGRPASMPRIASPGLESLASSPSLAETRQVELPRNRELSRPSIEPINLAPSASATMAMHREPSKMIPSSDEVKSGLHESTRPGVPQLGELELPREVTSDIFSASSDFRVAYVQDNTLFVRGMKPRTEQLATINAVPAVTALALGLRSALMGREDGSIDMVNIATGNTQRLFESVFKDAISSLAIGPEEKWMVAATQGGRLYLKQPNKDERDWTRVRSGDPIDVVALSPQGDIFAVARKDGTVELSRSADPKQVRLKLHLKRPVRKMAFSEDGYLLAVCLDPTKISLFQVISGQHFIDIKLRQSRLMSFIFSRENNLMAFLADESRLFVMDLHSRQAEHISYS